MARPKKIDKIQLTDNEREYLEKITYTRTEEAQRVQRAKIILLSSVGMRNSDIAEKLDIHPNSVGLCLKKYRELGIEEALNDRPGRGKKPIITEEEKVWIKNLACQKPTSFGYAQELWTYRKLQKHIHKTCEEAGYPKLIGIAFSTISDILNEADIKPHRIRYYLEKRDPEFDKKMKEVLIVYKQIEFQFENDEDTGIVTVSYDEKPGIQAIANTIDDLLPC